MLTAEQLLGGAHLDARQAAHPTTLTDTGVVELAPSMPSSERPPEVPDALERGSAKPMFDLASFSIPPRWKDAGNEVDRAAVERYFEAELKVALRPFFEQLP